MRRLNLDNEFQRAGKDNLDEVMASLRALRRARGLSQKALADKADISLSIVSKYETGRYPTRLVWYAAQLNALGLKMIVVDPSSMAPTDDPDSQIGYRCADGCVYCLSCYHPNYGEAIPIPATTHAADINLEYLECCVCEVWLLSEKNR